MDECVLMLLFLNFDKKSYNFADRQAIFGNRIQLVPWAFILPGVPDVLKSHEHRPRCKFGIAMSAVCLPKLPRTAAIKSIVIV